MIDAVIELKNIAYMAVNKLDFSVIEVKQNHIQHIESLELQMKEMQPVELPVNNYFSKGVYARELFIPKGTVLTGYIHKYTNLNILSKGKLSILTENGVIEVSAPYTVVSPAGTKRLAYAHEDTIWTTIHGTDETDIDMIEGKFIAHSYDEYLAFCAMIEEK
jgi:hypothetical protein